jgi:hypothetical protein
VSPTETAGANADTKTTETKLDGVKREISVEIPAADVAR